MSYLVLARKYRPQCFEEVVKQEHITKALGNALTSGRLAHAILLSGPRGTGKTTIARILAKCVNCETGPTATPCNKCRSCREITSGHAPDVFEIDGASNNKVDNIRELRENANYMPAHSPYKIYIIDEVHMLSDSAFNALLKVLEEPPAHVKFFFATTESNKIPITILSRCQRHDCRRVDIDSIINHMASLCKKENVTLGTDELTVIAREADGSIRDALSLLDLIITSAIGDISMDHIVDVLGGRDRQSLFEMSSAVFNRDAGRIIETIDRLYERGQHMTKLFAELLEHFRNLLVIKIGGKGSVLSNISEYEQKGMQEQVKDVSEIYLNQILNMLFGEEYNIKQSTQPKLAMEIAFIRAVKIKPALPLDTLIEKIDTLQKAFADTCSTEDGPDVIGLTAPAANEAIPPVVPQPADSGSYDKSPVNDRSNKTSELKAYPQPSLTQKKADGPGVNENRQQDAFTKPSETLASAGPDKQIDEPVDQSWSNIKTILSDKHPDLSSCLADSSLAKVSDTLVEISFKANKFNINYTKRKKNLSILTSVLSNYFEKELQVSLKAEIINTNGLQGKKINSKKLENETLNHPLVVQAMKLFNGKIVDIKIL